MYISLYGTNFGPSGGSVAICAHGATPCTSTPDVSVTGITYWSDNQVNEMVTTSSTASGPYDVQLTSGGESPVSLGGSGFFSDQQAGQTTSPQSNVAPFQVQVSVSLSPATLSMSTGDTNQIVTTSVSPPSVSFSAIYSPALATNQPPGSPCTPTLSIPSASGTGSVSSYVQASPTTCGGVFNLQSFANTYPSSNISVITIPPQALIQQMVGAAGGFSLSVDPGQVAQRSVGIAAKNRFTLPGFGGGTTWQYFQNNGTIENSAGTLNGPPVVIDNAVAVYTGVVTSSYVGGAPCYWSPQYQLEFIPIQAQYQSQPNATTLPSGLLLPGCYTQPGQYQQIVWKQSEPSNINPGNNGVYLNAPAFLFVKLRSSTDPAIVQIP